MAKPGTFQKGVSGNPNGRPKAFQDVVALARSYTATAMAALARIAGDEAQPPAAIVAASVALLDRGWGKPKIEMDVSVRTPIARSDDAALLAIAMSGGRYHAPQTLDSDEFEDVVH